ncbi:hypothetical protein [Paenibacillus flagellatus]|uniref:hypothetical protein n=1 Tax=Paenibacillus flagellatus TaxID=2211139 RepID=UPI0013051406|nr:hypothetical protein [Paenibacillus flagellatus]
MWNNRWKTVKAGNRTMNETQLNAYLHALDACSSLLTAETEPGLVDRIEEMKWIFQRLYKQPLPEAGSETLAAD